MPAQTGSPGAAASAWPLTIEPVGTYNVCQTALGGIVRDEKWTDNAGMLVEEQNSLSRVYHCSHCLSEPADFTNLVYRVTITPAA
jgi:hypothetical protein